MRSEESLWYHSTQYKKSFFLDRRWSLLKFIALTETPLPPVSLLTCFIAQHAVFTLSLAISQPYPPATQPPTCVQINIFLLLCDNDRCWWRLACTTSGLGFQWLIYYHSRIVSPTYNGMVLSRPEPLTDMLLNHTSWRLTTRPAFLIGEELLVYQGYFLCNHTII